MISEFKDSMAYRVRHFLKRMNGEKGRRVEHRGKRKEGRGKQKRLWKAVNAR